MTKHPETIPAAAAAPFARRIGLQRPLEELATRVCHEFELGVLQSCALIECGYEDFNFVIKAGGREYVAKVFSAARGMEECRRYVEIMSRVVESGVATPALMRNGTSALKVVTLGKTDFRLCLMERIRGDNLFRLRHVPGDDEIVFIAEQAALISRVPLQPPFVYDSWAVTSFAAEYAAKADCLPEADRSLIAPLAVEFQALDLAALPHCFVHGDIIETNVLRDENAALWIVDFSVSNYSPRIQELAVLACSLCICGAGPERSRRNWSLLLESYCRREPLTERELACLPLYVKLAHAMHLLEASYELVAIGNRSEENAYWIRQAQIGLRHEIPV